MPLTGFGGGNTFNNSKVNTAKVLSDTPGSAQSMVTWGNNSKVNVGLASNTKAAINPTSDGDENGRAPQESGDESMTPSTKGGASGDGPTPGFTGSGSGISELNGAQGN